MQPSSFFLRLVNAWLIACLLTGMNTHTLLAATYYVDVNRGDDKADAATAQSPGTPWASLTRALSEESLASGDIIRVAEGVYLDTSIDEGPGFVEDFPLELVDGVAILGSGPGTVLVAGGDGEPVFYSYGALGPNTWISDLALHSESDGFGIFLAPDSGVSAPTIDSVVFGHTLNDGIRANFEESSGTFAPLIQNNTFSNRYQAVDVFVSGNTGTVSVAPMIQGNAFHNTGNGLGVSAYGIPSGVDVEPVIAGNIFTQSGGDINAAQDKSTSYTTYFYGYGFSAPLVFAPTVVGNSIAGSDGIVDFYLSSISVADDGVTVDVEVSDNDIADIGNTVSVQTIYSYSVNSDVDVVMSGNTLSGVYSGVGVFYSSFISAVADVALQADGNEGGLGGDLINLYWQSVYGVSDLDAAISVSGNTLAQGSDLVQASASSMSTASVAYDISVQDNDYSADEGDGVYVGGYNLYGVNQQVNILASGNTMVGAYDGVAVTFSSNSSGDIDVSAQVQGNRFYGMGGSALSFNLYDNGRGDTIGVDATLDGNTISGAYSGLFLSITSVQSQNVTVATDVRDNDMSELGSYGSYYYLYDISYGEVSSDVVVDGNTIQGTMDGVYVGLSSMTSVALNSDVEVTDNDMSDVYEVGVRHYLESMAYASVDHTVLVAGNSITDSSVGVYGYNSDFQSASVVSNITVLSNTITGGSYGGVYQSDLDHSGGSVESNLLIAGNTITNRGDAGISVTISEMSNSSMYYEVNWTITNNTITNTRYEGVVVDVGSLTSVYSGGLDLVVAGNTVTGAGYEGVDVYVAGWSYSNPSQNIVVAGNTITDGVDYGINVSLYDSSSLSGNSLTLRDNVVHGNQGDGIYLYSSDFYSTFAVISGNTITANQGAGLYLSTATLSSSSAAADAGGGPRFSKGLNTLIGNGEGELEVGGFERGGVVLRPTLYAQENWWGTTDPEAIQGFIIDADDGRSGAVVDAGLPLEAAPSVSATASLSASILDDTGASGASPGDVVTMTATLVGTGDIGCASASFHADIPTGASLVSGSVATTKGTPFYTDGVDVGLQWLAANETVTVTWEMTIPEDTECGALMVQGRLLCQQLGTVLTDDPGVSGDEDATAVTLAMESYYADDDGDGEGAAAAGITSCLNEAPEGYVTNADDCDDSDAAVNTGATEVCDGADNDCDGSIDEAVTTTYYADGDDDGYGDANNTVSGCSAPLGYISSDSTDCDDEREDIYPGATEVCDGVDNDCDESVDEDGLTTFYADDDGDGHGDSATTTESCGVPSGYVLADDDCDDGDDDIYPGATETCDLKDNDCDNATDESGDTFSYADDDDDGYGDPNSVTAGCTVAAGYVSNADDCDDTDEDINPDATEVCNGEDDDCDRDTDEGVESAFYADDDDDGYGDPYTLNASCSAPSGYVSNPNDCDDTNGDINPAATEVCDGADNDCDRYTDEDLDVIFYADADEDGYGDPATAQAACEVPSGSVTNGEDCDDAEAAVNPEGTETCNDVDDDCNGYIDDADECTPESTPGGVDGGGGGGCDTSGTGGQVGWMALLLLGVALRRRRHLE